MITETYPYLTFQLGAEKFAIKVDCVQEIIEFGHVTHVPNAAAHQLGIVNLRGKVLPVIDTKIKLGMNATVPSAQSRIIVLDIPLDSETRLNVGALVDYAREVVEVKDNEIQPSDSDHDSTNNPVTGIINNHGDITLVMDVKKVFGNSITLN